MENASNQPKLNELLSSGYEFTGKNYKVLFGENKGREFPVYAQKGDIAALVYNDKADKIELVYKLTLPYTGKQSKASKLLDEIKKINAN